MAKEISEFNCECGQSFEYRKKLQRHIQKSTNPECKNPKGRGAPKKQINSELGTKKMNNIRQQACRDRNR